MRRPVFVPAPEPQPGRAELVTTRAVGSVGILPPGSCPFVAWGGKWKATTREALFGWLAEAPRGTVGWFAPDGARDLSTVEFWKLARWTPDATDEAASTDLRGIVVPFDATVRGKIA